MSEPVVRIIFNWQSFMPDHRQFKQNSVILVPKEVNICVDLPITKEYVYNAQDGLVAGLYSDKFVPILTPLGMRYCMDQLESVLPDVPLQAKDFNPNTDDDEGWDKGDLPEVTDGEEGW